MGEQCEFGGVKAFALSVGGIVWFDMIKGCREKDAALNFGQAVPVRLCLSICLSVCLQ